jgi:hypothetical protein
LHQVFVKPKNERYFQPSQTARRYGQFKTEVSKTIRKYYSRTSKILRFAERQDYI